ncbi:MAG: glycoside hydrolase family 47 protein [Acidobacteriaceae bacterium]
MLTTLIITAMFSSLALAQTPPNPAWSDAQKATMADHVRQEFLHAWSGYKQYAWGHDEVRPLSKQPHDWYGVSLLMTPVDGLDTMILMGLTPQADEARKLIDTQLNFNQDIYVKNFEITIRLLGGLLSSYELSHDKRLLELAEDLGARLLPAFNSPTGMPYVFVNLKTGAVRGVESNPAEIGTLILEFGTLSKFTGKPIYFERAKRALTALYKRQSPLGLVGASINVETGKWTDETASITGGIDSYYEYLLKCSILFGDKDCDHMWHSSITAVNKYLADDRADDRKNALWYGQANMYTGKRISTEYGALDAFFPAVLALSGDLDRARLLQESSYKMWELAGIEPEVIDYSTMAIKDPHYQLRPEIIESTYYLHYFTNDPHYLDMGKTFYDGLVRYARTDVAFAALDNVQTKQKRDSMESFFFAETLKYLYLLYAPKNTLDLTKTVFNTEAHPLSLEWPR